MCINNFILTPILLNLQNVTGHDKLNIKESHFLRSQWTLKQIYKIKIVFVHEYNEMKRKSSLLNIQQGKNTYVETTTTDTTSRIAFIFVKCLKTDKYCILFVICFLLIRNFALVSLWRDTPGVFV